MFVLSTASRDQGLSIDGVLEGTTDLKRAWGRLCGRHIQDADCWSGFISACICQNSVNCTLWNEWSLLYINYALIKYDFLVDRNKNTTTTKMTKVQTRAHFLCAGWIFCQLAQYLYFILGILSLRWKKEFQVSECQHWSPPIHRGPSQHRSHSEQISGLRRCRNVSSADEWAVLTQVTPPTQMELVEEQIQGPMLSNPRLQHLTGASMVGLTWTCH
jgi:hypothetical protein